MIIHIILSAFALISTFTLPAEVFLPKTGQEGVYVSFELVPTGDDATPQAKKAMSDLRVQVLKSHRLQDRGDLGDTHAKCTVVVHQPSRQDKPAYRLDCWSLIPGRNEGAHEKYHEAATVAEVLVVGRAFAQEHFRRLQEPAPAPMREQPQDRRTLIRTI